ncbi:EF-hand domain-containing protein [bacterium]|nr:EF-hand domain-containing protein [bacterium]MBU1636068.1 EF-hand domain-containing protein [bacterium]MBU1920082.1 EF-hand domain-containing protein [bacterium]
MNIESIGTTTYDLEAMRNRFLQFRNGESTLSKDDLSQIASQSKGTQKNATDPLQTLISNFESIDLDGNGMSLGELQDYVESNDLNLAADRKTSHRPDGPPPAPKSLTKDDLNQMIDEIALKNGQAPEDLQALHDSFDTADSDQDGTISQDEFGEFMSSQGFTAPVGGMPPHGGMMPPISDVKTTVDESTEVSETDPIQILLNNFKEVDVDGNGISIEELQAYADSLVLNTTAVNKEPTQGSSSPPPEPKDLTKDDLNQMISDITSKKGQVPSELQSMLDSFDSADTNQDGVISPDEFEAYISSQSLAAPNDGLPPVEMRSESDANADKNSASADENSIDEETRALLRMIQKRLLAAYSAYSNISASTAAVDLTT